MTSHLDNQLVYCIVTSRGKHFVLCLKTEKLLPIEFKQNNVMLCICLERKQTSPEIVWKGKDQIRRNPKQSAKKLTRIMDLYSRIIGSILKNELQLKPKKKHKVQSQIKSIIPPTASCTRFSKIQQDPYVLKLDTNRTNAFANSFIPMTSRDWNSLPSTVFPTTYIFQDQHPQIPSTPTQSLNLSFSRYKGPPRTTEIVVFWCNFFL